MPPRYIFTLVVGHNFRTRAIGFLEESEHGEFDAKAAFDSLNPKLSQLVNTRFGHWLSRQIYQKYFHNFSGEHSKCFEFKWEVRHIPQRLYGFLCHPMPKTEPAFELCVLVYFSTKEDATDYYRLDRINQLRQDLAVMRAIAQVNPELQERKL